jgi:general secretion pathway protein E/type IV pilus assembly protein PilB
MADTPETGEQTFTSVPRTDLLQTLLERGKITPDEAEQARRRQRRGNLTPQQALVDLGTVAQEDIYRAVADSLELPFVQLDRNPPAQDALQAVPVKVVLHYKFLPLALDKGVLTAAFSDPPAMRDRQNLRLLLGLRLKPVVSTPIDINRSIKQFYGLGAETVLQLRQDRGFQEQVDQVKSGVESQDLEDADVNSASVIHLFNQFLVEALEMGATDVHIEPFEERVIVRYRIDGLLREIPTPAGLKELHPAIVSRAKIMANLNIAEHRLPHDGRLRVNIGEEEFDLRVSILPTRFGETLNLRILNRSSLFIDLAQLGLEKDQMTILLKLLELPHGMILVTGPTGSGKSTTLYASLDKTDKKQRKVITVEDPVEYQLEGISQIQMHASIGLTFARGLRSILRHDPDIILVGEIRDAETAEIAIRAALTGHLVLSTLHTNDSVGAVNRLVDMDVEPFLVASSLSASIAQRLVRRICPHCKEEQTDIPERIQLEIADAVGCSDEEVKAWRGKGCVECGHSGYRGRVAIYEFFLMNEHLEDMVTRRATTVELRQAAAKQGMRNLRQDGWAKVMHGVTTIEEINRITKSFDIHY